MNRDPIRKHGLDWDRHVAALLLGCVLLVAGGPATAAEPAYPSRPLRLVVAFPAGGPPDVNARALAAQLNEQIGRPVVIDNRSGAGGAVGIGVVAKAAPDGYTFLFISQTFLINSISNPDPSYDIDRDFTPVAKLADSVGYLMVINPSIPASNLKEWVALSRTPGRRLAYGTPGIGSSQHLAGELFKRISGAQMMHVPYRGVAPALNAVLGGQEVQMISLPPTVVVDMVKTGKLRALAITSPKRWPVLPDVPTAEESGVPGYQFKGGWHGVLAPANTPAAIVTRIQTEINKAVQASRLRDFLVAGGYEPSSDNAAAFGKFLKSDRDRWAELIKLADLSTN